MLAACRKCGFEVTVATVHAAATFTCPACGGGLVLLSVAEGPPEPVPLEPESRPFESLPDDISIALPAPSHEQRWKTVCWGLRLIHTAWAGAVLGCLTGCFIGAIIGATSHRDARLPEFVPWAVGSLAIVYVILGMAYGVGLVLCCLTPKGFDGRRYIEAATAFLLLAPPAAVSYCVFAAQGAELQVKPDWHPVLVAALLASALLFQVLGMGAWLLFQKSVASHFHNRDLATSSRACLFGVCLWGGGIFIVPWMLLDSSRLMPLSVLFLVIWLCTGCGIFYPWLMRLLTATRLTIRAALNPTPSGVEEPRLRHWVKLDL
jgi:hypothetical protein